MRNNRTNPKKITQTNEGEPRTRRDLYFHKNLFTPKTHTPHRP